MFYDTLINLCVQHNVKITPLLKSLGVAKSSPASWKKGASPNSDIVIKLAEYFNVSIDYLLLGKEPTIPSEYQSLINDYEKLSKYNKSLLEVIISSMIDFQSTQKKCSQIKTINIRLMRNKVSAGIGYDLNFNSDDDFKNIKVLDTLEAESADFAVTVEGESMSPDFHDGDIVLVKQQDNIDIGQIGIFTIDGDGYIKEYGKDCLISHNPKYPDIYPEEYQEVKCYGLVLGKTTIIE